MRRDKDLRERGRGQGQEKLARDRRKKGGDSVQLIGGSHPWMKKDPQKICGGAESG